MLGHEAQRRLAGCDVLLVGLRGVGVETGAVSRVIQCILRAMRIVPHCDPAKNLALMGVRSITLSDDGSATWFDLSSQVFRCHSAVLCIFIPIFPYSST